MVGGFSQSPVLYDRIKSAFPNMEVICPQDAVFAIVKGAVMFGNNPRFSSTDFVKHSFMKSFLNRTLSLVAVTECEYMVCSIYSAIVPLDCL
jgi:hypothetical protein